MTIRAAIDIGTNAVLLTIAREQADGSLSVLHDESQITRLGRGVDEAGFLQQQAMERTLEQLKRYSEVIERWQTDRLDVAATSAMRDAANGPAFRAQVQQVLGCAPVIVSGDEEAQLTFAGALSDQPANPQQSVVVFDIGGGSTEVILGNCAGDIAWSRSLNLGSVRLTERHGTAEPWDERRRATVQATITERLAQLPALPEAGLLAMGVAGTATTLSALAQRLSHYDSVRVHRSTLGLAQLSKLRSELLALGLDERRELPALEPGRADVIAAGAVLCEELLLWTGCHEMVVSERGVRFGLLRRR